MNVGAGLDELTLGQVAVVAGFAAESLAAERLAVLGFLPGAEVRLLRSAPWGDPRVYSVAGRTVGLRREDARAVRMQLSDPV